MWGWQGKALASIVDQTHALLVAPCGSGKTTLLVVTGATRLVNSGFKQRQLYVVPQSHIGKPFARRNPKDPPPVVRVGKKNFTWDISNVLVLDGETDKIDRLKAFIKEQIDPQIASHMRDRVPVIREGVMITTHSAAAQAWRELMEEAKESGETDYLRRRIKNLSVTVDEAHHVDGIYDDDERGQFGSEERRESTWLGEMCRFMYNQPTRNSVQLLLATATPMRGDNTPILYPKAKKGTYIHTYTLDEHFPHLSIKTIRTKYEMFATDPIDRILQRVKEEPSEFHLICLPSRNTGFRTDPTDKTFTKLKRGLEKILGKEAVLDLVTTDHQPVNKERLLGQSHDPLESRTVKAIISCQLVIEGTDWVPCSRIHNAALTASIVKELQKIGRVMRDCPGKEEVAIFNYIPSFLPEHEPDKDKARAKFNDYMNALLLGMIWDDTVDALLQGGRLNRPFEPQPRMTHGVDTLPTQPTNSPPPDLLELLGSDYSKVMTEVATRIEPKSKTKRQCVEDVILPILGPLKIKGKERVADMIYEGFTRRMVNNKLKLHGISVEFVREAGFEELLWEQGMRNDSLLFADFDRESWPRLREICTNQLTLAEDKKKAEIRSHKYGTGAKTASGRRLARSTANKLRQKQRTGVPLNRKEQVLKRSFPPQA